MSEWMDISEELDDWRERVFQPLLNRVAVMLVDRILRCDEGGWPLRDAAVPEEVC